MGLPKALIFDVDGTLADTERDGHRVAFNAAFREAGLDWEWDIPLYGELLRVTGGKERMNEYARQFHPAFLARPDAQQVIAELHKAKTRHYTAFLSSGQLPLRPGVKRLLVEARAAGITLAIATTTTPENVTALLRYSLAEDAERWFAEIGAGDVVPAKKPAPDIYHYVLQRLGLSAQECMAFEDSANGVRSARGAGLPVVVTLNDYTRDDDVNGAVAVLDHLGEPGLPFAAYSGRVNGHQFVSLAMLSELMEQP